ncbi:MAG TPA: ribosomal-processing cysteine protease Prp [Syntrophomonadaceae bacterium]|nr:ribosomal-processing cysteine protease Prp [Syntrophomonadaceae bacterium]HQE22889.1 ribosomal-processing cysteine protease Prp [Syntrophomonadaceae bacterium]
MILITFTCQGSEIQAFTVEGHAGYAPEGEDIYCAGVSAIAQTTLLGLIKHLSREPVYEIRKGWLSCQLPSELDEEDKLKAQVLLSTLETGVNSMMQAYQGFVRVEYRRC